MNLYLGTDPDLKLLSLAVLSDGEFVGVHVHKVRGGGIGLRAVENSMEATTHLIYSLHTSFTLDVYALIEGQRIAYTGRTNCANPQDLIHLAMLTGGLYKALQYGMRGTALEARIVYPQEWKGSVPKEIHQQRTLTKLGIPYEMKGGNSPYPVPLDYKKYLLSGECNASDWKDINDSIGLALKAREIWGGKRAT